MKFVVVRSTIAFLFILSGATSLVYEMLWIRVLSLGVGSTSASMSLVLTTFFLGLSIGSYVAGRHANGLKFPLLVYGGLEFLLGLISLVILPLLFRFHSLLAFFQPTNAPAWIGLGLKFALIFVILILPTVCMGATLPILLKVLEKSSSFALSVSRLYALNTLGAVLGAFCTGFILIPIVGISGASYVAVATNLSIGIASFLLQRNIPEQHATKKAMPFHNSTAVLTRSQKMVLFACGVSGFVSVASEVVWSKYLSIYLGTNIYGLALVLALYLLGMAIGSFLLSLLWHRIRNPINLLIKLQVVSACLVIVTSYILQELPKIVTLIYSASGGTTDLFLLKAVITSLMLLVPTSVFGILFPLSIAIVGEGDPAKQLSLAGLSYALNTIGAIIGSYLTGILLIPALGSSVTLRVIALIPSLLAIMLVYTMVDMKRKKLVYSGFIALSFILTLLGSPFRFTNLLKSAYHQTVDPTEPREKLMQVFSDGYEDFRLIVEGQSGIISLSHDPQDGPDYRNYLRLKTNGLNESIYSIKNPDSLPKYEGLIGLLPYILARNPKNAFVVGYGGGFTVDFLTETDLKKVHVVELEKGIIEAASFVHKNDNPILKRKNLKLQIEDARFILATKALEPQDIIVSQPSHSWLAGAANLFTKEFFEIVKDNLNPRGIFSQWLNLYNMDVSVLQSILKTFYSVFPYGAVFTKAGDEEMVLIGSKTTLDLNLQKLEAIAGNSIFRRRLSGIIVRSPYDILSLFSLSRQDILHLTESAPINTDRNAYAEIRQSRLFYNGLKDKQTPQQYLSAVFHGDYSHLVKTTTNGRATFYYPLLVSLEEDGQEEKFLTVLDRFESAMKKDPLQWSNLGYFCLKAKRFSSALGYLLKAFRNQKQGEVLNLLLSTHTEMDQYREVLQLTDRNRTIGNRITHCYAGYAALRTAQWPRAKKYFDRILADIPAYTKACGDFTNKISGEYLATLGKPDIAVPFLEAYYHHFPSDTTILGHLVSSYQALKDQDNLTQFREYLPQVLKENIADLRALTDRFNGAGYKNDASVLLTKVLTAEKILGSIK